MRGALGLECPRCFSSLCRRIENHTRKTYGRLRAKVVEEIQKAWGLTGKDTEKEEDDDDGPGGFLSEVDLDEAEGGGNDEERVAED